jgi:hypothetical protein
VQSLLPPPLETPTISSCFDCKCSKYVKVGNNEILPVPIQSNLPHIHLKVGPADSDHPPIEHCCLVDSAASLTNGNFYDCSKIAKAYPHLVHSVLMSKSSSPIVMSGIVHANGSAVTTKLPVAFVFYLPYLTRDGSPTTLSIATGPHTGVNIILGLPFAEATGMILDFSDNVADCKNLTCPPFSLFKKRAGVQVPSIPDVQVNVSSNPTHYNAFIAAIENLEHQMESVYGGVQSVPSRCKLEPSRSAVTFADQLGCSYSPRRALPCRLELLSSSRRCTMQILMLQSKTTGLGGAM